MGILKDSLGQHQTAALIQLFRRSYELLQQEKETRRGAVLQLASNATELMTQLSKVPEFAELRTTAPTVRDEGQSRERFSFEFTWRDAASGAAAK